MRRPLPQLWGILPSMLELSINIWFAFISNGYWYSFFCCDWGRSIHLSTKRFWGAWVPCPCVQVEVSTIFLILTNCKYVQSLDIKTTTNPKLYYLFYKYNRLILGVYVDDLLLTCSLDKLIAWCKKILEREFDKKEISLMHYFWDQEVWPRSQLGCYLFTYIQVW